MGEPRHGALGVEHRVRQLGGKSHGALAAHGRPGDVPVAVHAIVLRFLPGPLDDGLYLSRDFRAVLERVDALHRVQNLLLDAAAGVDAEARPRHVLLAEALPDANHVVLAFDLVQQPDDVQLAVLDARELLEPLLAVLLAERDELLALAALRGCDVRAEGAAELAHVGLLLALQLAQLLQDPRLLQHERLHDLAELLGAARLVAAAGLGGEGALNVLLPLLLLAELLPQQGVLLPPQPLVVDHGLPLLLPNRVAHAPGRRRGGGGRDGLAPAVATRRRGTSHG
ncbi:DNA polymerase III subunit delta [Babesia caballi]|uniref:DNA polymerase III subunit delta n=1 Tax=Babesia caballi TaxID=5871 RepID=A0AAV4LXK3_BABCB|nr:DNA polymerase III subunit delta [Babesia caballi]